MTTNYKNNRFIGYKSIFVFILFLICSTLNAQVRVDFTSRTPENNQTQEIFNIKGDFSLFGNTNLTLSSYDDNGTNSNSSMTYIDVDGDPNTFNSSTAELKFSNENGAQPECTKIIFAGLYWTGRASNNSTSPNNFTVTKNGITKSFDKHKVSLKGPLSSNYTEIIANVNDIYYPENNDGFMYSAYAEITEYVKTNGVGNYTVADIAIVEGNGGSTGYYGGWGIIVVYENYKMKWRDISIFDGHAYMEGNTAINHELPITGFNAVQNGDVNIKLGLMAGEGDKHINGDYFNILRSSDNQWQTLQHSSNSGNNFFNSSILTGTNFRNPNLLNNTGLDIVMMDIPNPNNSVIDNSQTSTTLRYGSTQDTYAIFLAAMAIDSYIPEPEGEISLVSINGSSGSNFALPGEEIELNVKVFNKGTEEINNCKIEIPIPFTTSFVNGSTTNTIYYSPLPTPNSTNLITNPAGSSYLIWDIGNLPIPNSPTDLLGEITFKLKVTEDCRILKNTNCSPSVPIYGYINGIGAITGTIINDKPFIQGYENSGMCHGNPILDPLIIDIDATNYINQNCQDTADFEDFIFCDGISEIPFSTINTTFPPGTQFYNSYPVTNSTTEYSATNTFPLILGTTTYYAVPAVPNGCYFTFTITVNEVPTASVIQIVNAQDSCSINDISPLPYSETAVTITLAQFLAIGGNVSNPNTSYTISYSDTNSGSCPINITRAFHIKADCLDLILTQTITIQDTTAPTFVQTIPSDVTVECSTVPTVPIITATDSCSNNPIPVVFTETTSAGNCSSNYTLIRTWTATDACGNIATDSQTITIQDTTAPTFVQTIPSDVTVECSTVPTVPIITATDSCSNNPIPVVFTE
ncbi:hypothetical protein FIA58_010045, partial [Flavobacterium jejuense]